MGAALSNAQGGRSRMPKGNCSITGAIADSITRAVIPYSTVVLMDSEGKRVLDGTVTKDNGTFEFAEIPAGEYKVKSTFLGYQSYLSENIQVSNEKNSMNIGRILLSPKSIETKDITVVGEKEQIVYKLDKKIVNISDNPAAQGGRISDALQNIPSVNVDMDGKVSIRGSENFQVLIDGKPTLIPGNDILKSIPADAVSHVELITNPSAKYDPDGSAGILNVVLKKASLNGISGIINSNASNREQYTADGMFNFRYEDLTFYSGINWEDSKSKSTSDLVRQSFSANRDTSYFIDPFVDRNEGSKGISLRGGLEYSFSENDYSSLSTNIYINEHSRFFPTKMSEYSDPLTDKNYYYNSDDFKIEGTYSVINGYYQHNFKGDEHKITANLNTVIWDGGSTEIMDKYSTDSEYKLIEESRVSRKGVADSRTFMVTSKVDYTLNTNSDFKIEAGYAFDYTQDYSDFLYQNFNLPANNWETDYRFTNDTKYYHSINAMYFTFSSELWGLNYQLGLRGEYFNRRLHQTTNSRIYNYDKFNFFPSFYLTKGFDETMQMQFSFSRRVQRPNIYALNPFPDYFDDYIVSIGNPELMPEFTDSYELNFTKNFDFLYLIAQSFYRSTENAFTRVIKMNDKQLWITSENVGKNSILGGELALNFTIFQGLRFNTSATVYQFDMSSTGNTNTDYSKGIVYNCSGQLFYSLTSSTLLQAWGTYFGPRYTGDGKVEPTYSMGFSLRQFFFDRRLTLFLTGRNILNSWKHVSENKRIDYIANSTMKPDGSVISLGFSFNINNYENKERPEDKIERNDAGGSGGS